MAKQAPIGARATADERIQFEHTLKAHNHQLPPIYSTPDMVRLMEVAGSKVLQPYCEAGEMSVGTSVNVEHRAPASINTVVRATAEVEEYDGRFYRIRVIVHDGDREIGRGRIGRTIVKVDEFLTKHGLPKP